MSWPVTRLWTLAVLNRYTRRLWIRLIVPAGLIALAVVWLVPALTRVVARGPLTAKTSTGSETPTLARLSERASMSASGLSNPTIKFNEGRDLITSYAGPAELQAALEQNQAEALSVAAADFDEDGVPDLVSGYAFEGRGILTMHRGNVDSIYPNAPEAQQRRANGTFTNAPFLSPAQVFGVGVAADFIGAGDFDADGHWDVVVASRKSKALHLLAGDGHGALAPSREIALPGAVTAFATGEVNRRDGLTDIVVGVDGPEGPSVCVFEGPLGALHGAPEVFAEPAVVTSLALGQLDDHYAMDLAVAAGNDLVIVHGRDRKLTLRPEDQARVQPARLSKRSLLFPVKSLVIGDFTGGSASDLALLAGDGNVSLLSSAQLEGKRTVARKVAGWRSQTLDGLPAVTALLGARVSSLPKDDLVLVDSANHQLHVVNQNTDRNESGAAASVTSISLNVAGGPAALLPMRLNSDAVSDFVVLSRNSSSPIFAPASTGSTFTVTNTNDSGSGSLRQAIIDANANAGADTITFSIGSGTQTITPTSALPSTTGPVTIDGTTQPGFAGTPIIEISGTGAGGSADGLTITGGNSVVRGLVINRFSSFFQNGISLLTNNSNIVEGNYLGINVGGTNGLGNGNGVNVDTSNNLIGGTTAAARNVISGNQGNGVDSFVGGTGNVVQGNFIGTNAAGTARIKNVIHGVEFSSNNNTFGGTAAGARNIISGNGFSAISIAIASGNLIQGNYIGLAVNGTGLIGNGGGVGFSNADTNTVGGTSEAARNVISGQMFSDGNQVPNSEGVQISGNENLVQGNYIGTDPSGTLSRGNFVGVEIVSGFGNTVGGAIVATRNLISGNGFGVNGHGVILGLFSSSGPVNLTSTNLVMENYIGTDVTGTQPMGNSGIGVNIPANTENSTVETNLIAFNGDGGVRLPNADQGGNTSGIRIAIADNNIYSNGGLGIDLGPDGISPNDAGDPDTGANNLQNFPVLTSASPPAPSGGVSAGETGKVPAASVPLLPAVTVTVNGTLNSTPNSTFVVNWYFGIDPVCTSSQFGSRALVLGRVPNVVTDANGNATFSFPLDFPPGITGGLINCTATDPNGNTSEFSACFPVSALPTLSIDDVSHNEGNTGNTSYTFTANLSAASSQTITVNYATANDTATTVDSDYLAASGTLTFAPGEISKPITVMVNGDTKLEPDEKFLVNLTSPTNANIGDGRGQGTLVNDDSQPMISINDVSQNEANSGTSSFVFTASLSNASSQTITVNFATADGLATIANNDYSSNSGLITFPPGVTTRAVTVLVNGDTRFEPDENFFVNLTGPTNAIIGDNQGQGTIVNDDPLPSLSINNVNVSEGGSGTTNATFTVSLSAASGQTVTVQFATADGTASAGTDYQSTSGTLTFDPGDTSKPITVPVNGDTVNEQDETFFVNLSNGVNANITGNQGLGTILNDDGPQGSCTNAFSNSATITIEDSTSPPTRAAPYPSTVNVSGMTGNITKVKVGLNGLSHTFPDDLDILLVGPGGQNLILMSDVGGNFDAINLNLTLDDAAATAMPDSGPLVSGTFKPANILGGDVFPVPAPAGPYNSAAPDGTATLASVFNGTNPNGLWSLYVIDDESQDAGAISGGWTITITTNCSASTLSIGDVTVTEGNSGTTNANFTVSLNPASGDTVTVQYATADGTATAGSDYQSATGTLTFNPGETSKTITVAVNGDLANEVDETFFVNLSSATNASIVHNQGPGTISNDDPVPSLSVNDVSVTEGNSGTVNATFTVSLSAASGRTVTVQHATAEGTATAGSDYQSVTGTLTFNPGDTSKTINISVNGDLFNELDETFFANLSGATNAILADNQGKATILNDDAMPSLSVNDVNVAEGSSGTTNATFTVNLSAASGQSVTVQFATADGTASASSDYQSASGTLTFNSGETSKLLTIAVIGDTANEVDETFFVNLSGVSNANIGDGQGIGSILNDDVPPAPALHFSAANYSVNENAGSAMITVTRTGSTAGTSTVDYATSDGSATQNQDYVVTSGMLSFAAGETSKTFLLLIVDDAFVEANQTLNLTLSNATGGVLAAPGTSTVTISDNDSGGSPTPATKRFAAMLDGAQETPANNSSAKGTGYVLLSQSETAGSVSLQFQNLGSAETAAHIHGPGAAGVSAPILFTLPMTNPVTNHPISLAAQQVSDLKAGLHYLNVHSNNFPLGEIRGQLRWNPTLEENFFVRQQYLDFLSRDGDPGGFNFWVNQVGSCQADAQCMHDRTITTSNAFFFEPEFQQTAGYVFRAYRAAFGNNQPFPNPDGSNATEANKLIDYSTFVADRARVVGGANLAAAQQAFANQFVTRPAFTTKYAAATTAALFVDAILANIQNADGANLTGQRQALIDQYNNAGGGNSGRSMVLYRLADDNPQNPINNLTFINAEYNRQFALTLYFGYLRRNPDIGGFLFWQSQINLATVRDVPKQNALVCSFLTAAEYQLRFGPNAPRSNAECPQ